MIQLTRTAPMKVSRPVKFLALSLLTLAAACGRPASEEDCKEILHIAAELELKQRLGNAELIESEIKELEKSMHGAMMKKCVGKRISDESLTCMRSAKTPDDLFEKCF